MFSPSEQLFSFSEPVFPSSERDKKGHVNTQREARFAVAHRANGTGYKVSNASACRGRTKSSIRLGSGTGEFTGNNFLAFYLGKIGTHAAGSIEACIAGHEPKPLRHSPFLGEAHLAEALNLDGMQLVRAEL